LVSTFFIIAVLVGLGVAVILSIIPSYLTTRSLTPAAESENFISFFNKINEIEYIYLIAYCISSLRLTITFNTTTPYGNFNLSSANTSYPLSQAVC
jgi:hypothetical protein